MLAVGLLLTGVFVLALQDSLIKYMSLQTTFWQFQTLRSMGNITFVVILAMLGGGLSLIVPKNPKAVSLRAVFMTCCMFCFFAAAPHLTVPQLAAGLYTYPVFVSMMAAPVLGEKIGSWRISAIVLGVAGAALILNPWAEDFSTLQLLPVAAGFFYACNILVIRKACRNESTLALAFVVGIAFVLSGIAGSVVLTLWPLAEATRESMPFVAIGWPELTLAVAGFALFCSTLNLTGNICLSRAYQTADSSLLAPIDFSYLVFAAIWSKVIFDHWPTPVAIMGMAMIAVAGIITAWRETRAPKSSE